VIAALEAIPALTVPMHAVVDRFWRADHARRRGLQRSMEKHQEASSQVMAKITGTESSVATKIVSRAKITPRS
jgi:hypothetical protein